MAAVRDDNSASIFESGEEPGSESVAHGVSDRLDEAGFQDGATGPLIGVFIEPFEDGPYV